MQKDCQIVFLFRNIQRLNRQNISSGIFIETVKLMYFKQSFTQFLIETKLGNVYKVTFRNGNIQHAVKL